MLAILGIPVLFVAYMVVCFFWGIAPKQRTFENLVVMVISGGVIGFLLGLVALLFVESIQRAGRVAEIKRQNAAKKKRDAEREAAKQGGTSVAR
ncbi:hypothetical protein A2924_01480 [Candidatus Giovannonibacteria bacterium RIFCSPLOWO2_01_FULL_44_16]|uniref:Lipopolysaccharide assembly protein A domain-containing protein n=1 Tax=Candidatus Giovannonibacteria bacterium RIFCSPLOWO2_01_FULL_44_16 TaxID=1798348 RepID=A0A1F5X4P8_9BACT|nr:MAG: hypothetical protein A2924_01480 [Candidatus Giovannonibacteria bacterium RIFCSPLOWO2_01_FULL_44_16]